MREKFRLPSHYFMRSIHLICILYFPLFLFHFSFPFLFPFRAKITIPTPVKTSRMARK